MLLVDVFGFRVALCAEAPGQSLDVVNKYLFQRPEIALPTAIEFPGSVRHQHDKQTGNECRHPPAGHKNSARRASFPIAPGDANRTALKAARIAGQKT
jgi:hypothetical protein